MGHIKKFGITFAVFMGIDLIWLVFVANKFYAQQLGYLMAEQVNWAAAMIFYIVFIIALLFFVVQPALNKKSWKYAILAGAFFGFVTYGTYDLTNLATIKDWPVLITVIDLIWGSTLTGVTSLVGYLLIKKWVK